MSTPESSRGRSRGSPQKTMADLLALPKPERTLINWLIRRRRASLSEILHFMEMAPATGQPLLDSLLQAGFLVISDSSEAADDPVFQPNLVSRKRRSLPDQMWDALD